jgi:hypothetical protein
MPPVFMNKISLPKATCRPNLKLPYLWLWTVTRLYSTSTMYTSQEELASYQKRRSTNLHFNRNFKKYSEVSKLYTKQLWLMFWQTLGNFVNKIFEIYTTPPHLLTSLLYVTSVKHEYNKCWFIYQKQTNI